MTIKTVVRKIAWLVFILSNFASIALFAQVDRTISTKEGLPQSFVSGLEQDQTGFIWIGTRNGLARYDGLTFKVFQHNNADSSSLASNLIINTKQFNQQIWIEHESGEIDRFDPVHETIKNYPAPSGTSPQAFFRRAWIADSKGVIWRIVDGAGLCRYGTKPRIYTKKSSGFDSDTLWGLREGNDGRLWVLTKYGLGSLDQRSGVAKNYGSPGLPNYHNYQEAVRFPVAIHERTNGQLMWADRNFLFFFSPASGKFLKRIPFSAVTDRAVTWIRTGPDGSDYFEREGSLYRYDDSTGLTLIYAAGEGDKGPMQSFLVDQSGLFWLGTDANGISQIDLTTPYFPSFPNQDGFAGDVMETVFGESIANLFDWQPQDQRFAAPGYHLRSAYDKSGTLWVGLKEQVVGYDSAAGRFVRLPKLTQVSNPGERGIGIKGLTISPENAPVVVGYNGNVLTYNRQRKSWEWLVPDGAIRRKFGSNVKPQDIEMDQERIWITTEMDGLLVVDRSTGRINQIKDRPGQQTLPTNQLLGSIHDPSRPEILWIGSRSGLISLNKQTLKTKVFNTKNGLPDNTIYSLLADHYGNLWFGTNKGLCRFNPITQKIRVFQTRHGLLEDEFNRFHQLALPDGRLAFGGTVGYTLFDPEKIKEDHYQPKIALTALKINNEPMEPARNGLLQAPLNAVEQLVLPYDQSTVTFYFAGLQFNQPHDLRYRYKLSGYDNDWVSSGFIPFANYTKIPPGDYEFVVNASNTTGQWSKEIDRIRVVIHPPWWRTWWAYLIYALVFAGSLWYWMRQQTIKLQLQRSIEMKKQEAEQLRVLAEMKERFFTNITHDFRTPLTLILSPLAPLMHKLAGTDAAGKLASVKRNAEQLLGLINQLLDVARLDARMLTVDESIGDLGAFCENTVNLFCEEAAKNGIVIGFSSHVQGYFWFDAALLERILGNLIGNALKFTSSGGKVRIAVSAEAGQVLFSVADTGIGIAADRVPFIFERYYQIDQGEQQKIKGSGIGLTLVKELVEIQNGRIEVESIYGEGTTFRVFMPYQPALLADSTISQNADGSTWDVPVAEGEDIRILLVEDNGELSEFIAGSLPDRYKVDKAVNGADGLEMALETIPDLIISDVMMPVMDGFEFCKQIKAHVHTSHIPVILLTAKAAVESRMQGLSTGADDYLTKPFHVQELNLRVYNLLERQRKLRAHIQKELNLPSSEVHSVKKLDPFLTKFYEVIDEDLDNSSVTVDQLASKMNLSRSQLHRKLRAVADMTVIDVVRNYRLTKAASFLKAGFNSSESAYKSGFESPAYFSKRFHELYGVTPSEFAKNEISGN